MVHSYKTTERHHNFVGRDILWRDYRAVLTLPRARNDLMGYLRPTYGMAD